MEIVAALSKPDPPFEAEKLVRDLDLFLGGRSV